MINKLNIKNILSHKNTTVEFHPGVNLIKGVSDHGKSVILKALNLFLNNRPLNMENIKSWFAKDKDAMEIHGTIDNIDISRIKTSTKSYYKKGEDNYTAFGASVPADLQKIFNTNIINFQWQHDNLFMISWTPGEIAKFLNEMIDLSIIDRAIKKSNQKVKDNQTELDQYQINIKSKQASLLQYDELENQENDLIELELLDKKVAELITAEAKFSNKIRQIIDVEHELKEFKDIVSQIKAVNELIDFKQAIKHDKDKAADLFNLIQEIEKVKQEISTFPDYTDILQELNEIELIENKCNKLANQFNSLDELLNNIKDEQDRLVLMENEIKNKQKEFDDNFPDICPLCGKEK